MNKFWIKQDVVYILTTSVN